MFGTCGKCGNAMIVGTGEPCPTCGTGVKTSPVRPNKSVGITFDDPVRPSGPVDVNRMVADINSSVYAQSERQTLHAHAKTFLGVGGLLLAFAGAWAAQTFQFTRSARPVTGIVATAQFSQSNKGMGSTANTVHYTAGGGSHEIAASGRGVGERVELLVSAKDPADARVNTLFGMWGGPLVLALIGAIPALIGGLSLAGDRPDASAAAESFGE